MPRCPSARFGVAEVDYLGHIVYAQGVCADPEKIKAISYWPFLKSIKSLRGFLGLTGYYRKFIRAYGSIAAPLMSMLKKNAFSWTIVAKEAFQLLKTAVSQAPFLALPNFFQPFVIECDASGLGIGAVLMQERRQIAYLSKSLKGKALNLSTYENELFVLAMAIQKWSPYLLEQSFVVRIEQQRLKFLLEQKVGTPFQQKWLTKLLGYDFSVEYKKGVENKVDYALSRKEEWDADNEMILSFLSIPRAEWVEELKNLYAVDPELQPLFVQWQNRIILGQSRKYSCRDGILLYKNRIILGQSPQLKQKVLSFVHNDSMAGHSGYDKTFQKAKKDFYWKSMRSYLRHFIRGCEVCQRNKKGMSPLPVYYSHFQLGFGLKFQWIL
jgi:hypothetical protein